MTKHSRELTRASAFRLKLNFPSSQSESAREPTCFVSSRLPAAGSALSLSVHSWQTELGNQLSPNVVFRDRPGLHPAATLPLPSLDLQQSRARRRQCAKSVTNGPNVGSSARLQRYYRELRLCCPTLISYRQHSRYARSPSLSRARATSKRVRRKTRLSTAIASR